MGIDITAYKNMKLVSTGHFDEDGDPITETTGEPLEYDVRAYVNPDFIGRADEIVHGGHYVCEQSFGVGCWGYSRYNGLRNELAKLAGYAKGSYLQYGVQHESYCTECWEGKQGPFSELVNFSDCEGVIGTAISKKLADDFAQFQGKADAHEDEQFRDFFNSLREGFEFASSNGFVVFH